MKFDLIMQSYLRHTDFAEDFLLQYKISIVFGNFKVLVKKKNEIFPLLGLMGNRFLKKAMLFVGQMK